MRRSRGTQTSSSLAITFDREGKTATAAMAMRATRYSTNPTTTKHQFAGVKHRSLPGSDGALRLIKVNLDSRGNGGGRDRRGCGLVLVPDLDLGTCRNDRRGDGNPVYIGHCHRGPKQSVVPPDDDALRRRLG